MKFPASEKSSRHPMHVFIAVTAVITLSLGVFLNQVLAAGTFGAAVSYSVVSNPSSIAVGDFNEDGILDMAVPSQTSSGTISILYGDGHGGFAPAMSGGIPVVVTVQAGANLSGILAKDLGNGHLDLVVAMQNVNQIAVLMGDGHGNFAPPLTSTEFFSTGSSPTNIVSADFNGDGFPDLAVTDQGGGVATFFGSTSTPGNFTVGPIYPTSGSTPVGIVAKDFNGDGFPDLVVTNMGSNTISILFGSAGGTFSAPVTMSVPNGPWSIATADFNEDGNPDLAVTGQAGNEVAILLGDGHGGFSPLSAPETFATDNGPRSIVAGNFGNGHQDLAITNLISNDVSILMGDGHGLFAPATPATVAVGTSPQYIVAGDFDGDGSLDLATADQGTNNISVLLDGTVITNVTSSTPDGTYTTGNPVSIQITFNKPVNVDTTGGTPTLNLAVGSPSVATYASGSGTDTLTFTYTVALGDASPDLDYSGVSALNLNGATIRDAAFNDASLGLPASGGTGSLSFNKNIVIDTSVVVSEPVLTETVPVPTPTTDNTPSYTFTSDEAGTLNYIPSGGCGTTTTSVVAGSNTITFLTPSTFLPLPAGTYSSCQLTVTDGSSNTNTLNVSSFTITPASGGGTTGGGTTGSGGGHGHPAVPYLREETAITTPSTNHTPTYVFTSSESGNISYGGGCSSPVLFAVNGVNSITFPNLPNGTYDSCTLTVTDLLGRANTLSITPFNVYTIAAPVAPPVAQQAPAQQQYQPIVEEPPVEQPVTLQTPTSEVQPIQNSSPAAVAAPYQIPGSDTTDGSATDNSAQSASSAPTMATPTPTPVTPETVVAPQPTAPAPAPVFGTEPNTFTPAVPSDQGAGVDFDATPTLTSNAGCTVGSSSGVLGTVGDILKWGVCATGAGIAHLFGK